MADSSKCPPALRAWGRASGLAFLACAVSCMSGPYYGRAAYGPDLEFRAFGQRGPFNEVSWSDLSERQPACPLVVHLPAGDLGDDEFRTVKAMTDLGGKPQEWDTGGQPGRPRQRVTNVGLERGTASIQTTYHDGRLVAVRVLVSGETRVTVRGKQVTLPATKDDLVLTFGEPTRPIE